VANEDVIGVRHDEKKSFLMETLSNAIDPYPHERPNIARVYDYLLEGGHHFEADRTFAEQLCATYPDTPLNFRVNRAFLRRAVTWLTHAGIDQFIDIGSGLPTVGNVHEIAQGVNPRAQVVYVDNDGVAVILSQTLLKDSHVDNRVIAIQADARMPEAILRHPEVLQLLDFQRPIAVLMFSILHFFADDAQVAQLLSAFREVIPSGSYLALSHATLEEQRHTQAEAARQHYTKTVATAVSRTRQQITDLFAGVDLVEPGVVWLPQWHPESPNDLWVNEPERTLYLGGVGRKP
jgi:hypothetical protein